ncbi:polyketide synthase [Penicillium canescens]|uniref:Polyketide synthase n=1 Tax=Penicillium canescens TaxID=5083 RepID=A0AAD6IMX6_PENCN|nr:polyketide synthase [Penicillium canescens]KAJ6018707.1 polyketide synthase [Penicillium canescens]KAJ6033945.1 polyketide synthase [Penicillium canescens]KAJ6056867.1 polyketide synthase [Penicillium canescens]KAJ6058176.1 polyketide synthase [Penicillium canescens]KAJ6072095.1 polyketide synthase [Penicillium canescens]
MADALKELLDEQGVFTRKLNVEHATHSAHMEQFSEEYKGLVGSLLSKHLLRFEHPVHMFSTLTGRLLDDSSVPEMASHWCDSMMRPVKFTEAVLRCAVVQRREISPRLRVVGWTLFLKSARTQQCKVQ